MSFFSTLYNSLYNFKWLRNQRNNKSWAWGYFLLLMILVSGLAAITLGYKFMDSAPSVKKAVYNELPEFQAEVKNGQLYISGVEQPFIKNYSDISVVVDTVSTSTLDVKSFVKRDDQSVLLVTKDSFVVYNSDNKSTKTQAVKDFGDYKTDKTEILKKAEVFFSNKMMVIVVLVSFVGLLLFLSITNLLNVLFFSFLFYTIAKQQKINWQFKEVFTVGLFAITLPIILTQATPSVFLNWVFVLVYAGWMYMAILKKEKSM